MAHLDKIIVYINKTKDGGWLKKLDEYAKCNDWSISKAVRKLLTAFLDTNIPTEKPYSKPAITHNDIPGVTLKEDKTIEKLDPDTYFTQIESKLTEAKTSDIDSQMAQCIKEKTNSGGEISCYFFDNAREHHSFCKQHCWTREDIWHKRVRP